MPNSGHSQTTDVPSASSNEQSAKAAELPEVEVIQKKAAVKPTAKKKKTAPPTSATAEGVPVEAAKPATAEEKSDGTEPVRGYKAETSGTATKTNTAIFDTPVAIQVVPRDVIEDQNARRVVDAAENVSSVQADSTFGNRSQGYVIRGFPTSRTATDGFVSNTFFGESFQDPANIERVEVLKGPSSVLYGLLDPGGLINIVTKKPLTEPHQGFDATIGSYDFYRGEVDLTGPVTQNGPLYYRLIGAYQESDSFRDFFIDSRRSFFAPSLRWKDGDSTGLMVQFEYKDQEQQFDRGLIAIGDRADVLPNNRYLGERFSQYNAEDLGLRLSFDHKFNEVLSFRSKVVITGRDEYRLSADPRNLLADGRTLRRRVTLQEGELFQIATQNDLIAHFQTGFLGHTFLLGTEFVHNTLDNYLERASLASIDVFDPDYGATPGDFDPLGGFDDRINYAGVYVQDQIDIGTYWKLLLGGRYDYADQKTGTDLGTPDGAVVEQVDKVFTPRVGLVFQPWNDLSLYATYGESFLPQLGTTRTGGAFAPETGQAHEFGAKLRLFDDRVLASLAFFDITKQNVKTTDPVDDSFSILTGEQRSRGVEFDITGEVLPGWNLIASAAYVDAEIAQDETFEIGNQLANVPRHSGGIWSTYRFATGPLRGVKVGAGIRLVGERQGDLDNTFIAPAYARVDAALSYEIYDGVTAGLNVRNLFDKDYIEAATDRTQVYPGEPLTALATIKGRF